MTALQAIPKAAVEGAIMIARLPADALVGVAPETRITSAIETAVDRADATVRSAAGNALRDTELQREAGRLRSAVDERRRARELSTESGERARRASTQDIEARELAEKQHRTADLNAAKKRAAARRRREQAQSEVREQARNDVREPAQGDVREPARDEVQKAHGTEADPLKGAVERAQAERRTEDAKLERGRRS